jgi:multisubunit Na+/H+ antiporter MnhB subunit
MKKYYGILIALLPFVTGSYVYLTDWSNSEAIGYNAFSVALIGLGAYLTIKAFRNKDQN